MVIFYQPFAYAPNAPTPSAVFPELRTGAVPISFQTVDDTYTAFIKFNITSEHIQCDVYNSTNELVLSNIPVRNKCDLLLLDLFRNYYLFWDIENGRFEFGDFT